MFIEIPASKRSITLRKPVYSMGINDATYQVQPKINGKQITCPYYLRWKAMIGRCYSLKYQENKPTYIECSVCDDWLLFSRFKAWMIKQDWQGMHLDKDIIKPGNKIYSPDNCRFVTGELNSLFNYCEASRGDCPQGVNLHSQSGKYHARINDNGDRIHLGLHETKLAASAVYVKAKTKLILAAANKQKDPLIANGLRLHAKLLNS